MQKFYTAEYWDRNSAVSGMNSILDDAENHVSNREIVIGIDLISHRRFPIGYSILCYNGLYVVSDAITSYDRTSWEGCREKITELYLKEVDIAFRK